MEPRPNAVLRISDAKTLELIGLYEREPCLWNARLDGYKCRARRHEAAARIASRLAIKHFTPRFVVVKLKNLRNSYCQELKKVANSRAAADDPPYRPKVFWFQKMDSFLRPHLQHARDPASRLSREVTPKSEPPDGEDAAQAQPAAASADGGYDHSDSADDEPLGRPSKRSRHSSTASKKLRTEEPRAAVGLAQVLKEISSQLQALATQKDDFYDSFGKYVSSVLRNMPLSKALETQSLIVNLLAAKAMCKDERVVADPL